MKHSCFNCGMSENEIPLVQLTYKEESKYICPQCLPALIHAPQKLADKLPGIEKVKPAPHKP